MFGFNCVCLVVFLRCVPPFFFQMDDFDAYNKISCSDETMPTENAGESIGR